MTKVYLVGAGPGDPELITLKGRRCLESADVVLHDHLAPTALLEFAPSAAERIYVGKKRGDHAYSQPEIIDLMLAKAREGKTVVRLKGGDPFIFGRGGEEAAALRAHGIEVDVVCGITAGVAAAAALGAPLTHRAHAHGVVFVTGHARDGAAPLHWPTLAAVAAQGLTLVIYMGVGDARRLQAGLLEGLPAQTPAALVQHASLAHERRWITTLGELAADIERQGFASPAIIIVGDVLRGVPAMDLAANERAA
jgi:uroporphyrin-III C-methyltransferase